MNKDIVPIPELTYPQSISQEIIECIYLLELTFRLQNAFKKKWINERCFTDTMVIDHTQQFGIRERLFNAKELEARFFNLIFSTIGTLSIAVDKTLDKKFGEKKPFETDNINSLRAFFYQIRCAYAHDITNPTWLCKDKYQREYTVIIPKDIVQKFMNNQAAPEKILIFDFKKLHGKPVEFDSFNRFEGLVLLALYAIQLTQDIEK